MSGTLPTPARYAKKLHSKGVYSNFIMKKLSFSGGEMTHPRPCC